MKLFYGFQTLASQRRHDASFLTLNNETTCDDFVGSLNTHGKAPWPTGWIIGPNKTKCFLHVGRLQSWNESETCCNKYGGHLASLISIQELNFAKSLCNETIKY